MSWDFETEPEFQKELDWIERFVREEVEPLDYVLGFPYDVRNPKRNKLVRPLQAEVKKRKLWACHLGPELGGQGYGQVKLALINEILGRSRFAPTVFGCQAPDSGNAEILAHYGTARAEGALSRAAARQRDRVLLLDDRAAGRRRSQGLHHPGRTERRRLGDQRREVVLVECACRELPHRDGGDGSRRRREYKRLSTFIVPAETAGIEIIRNMSVGSHERSRRTPTCATTMSEYRRTICWVRGAAGSSSRRRGSAAAGSIMRCAPSDRCSKRST